MSIRDYRESDIPAMLAVIKAAFAEYRDRLDPPSSAERKTIEIVKTELEAAGALVTELEGRIVGCVFFRPQGDAVYLDRLSVLPEYRNRGLGSALVTEVERRSRSDGYVALLLSVRLALTQQQAYYNRLGFEFYEYGTHAGYTQPTYMKMRKSLVAGKTGNEAGI